MGLLSATASITRYKVEGQLQEPVLERIADGLTEHAIRDIDGNPSEQTTGWTRFQDPFQPNFDDSPFSMGTYLVFSLRVDKKSIPAKLVQKHCAIEAAKRLKEIGRDFLSRNEKKMIKDHVINRLNLKMPATPNIYDIVWHFENHILWFFSNLKSTNEALETLFVQSFGLNLIRLIPYTMAAFDKTLSAGELDRLAQLSPGNQSIS